MKNRNGKTNQMKPVKMFTALAAVLTAAGFFLSCENPIRAGLGPRVDIRGPTVELTAPVIGSYLNAGVVFTGTAEDDIEVKSVWIKLAEGDYVPAEFDAGGGTWRYTLNTEDYPDGDFRIRLRVSDSDNKTSETGELAFIIKNGRPDLEMLIPLIGLFNDDNPIPDAFNPVRGEGIHRALDTGGDLKGQALDMRGIDTDPQNAPRIRFWPADDYPGLPPDSAAAKHQWLPAGISNVGLTSASLSWPLKERDSEGNVLENQNLQADTYYRFQVKVRSRDGTEFIYPEGLYADPLPENRYVEIYLQAARELPLVSLAPASHPAQPYDLIEGLTSFKRGHFVLRISASHSRGIQDADIRYTQEGDLDGEGNLNEHTVEWDEPEGLPGETPTSKYFTYSPDTFPEGNYTFTVRVWGGGGSPAERDYTIRIDNTDPEITLNEVKGSAGMEPAAENGEGFDRYTVNGVIAPKVLIADPASGLRADENDLREQRWFVVDGNNHGAVQAILAGDPEHLWYPGPGSGGGYEVKAGGVIEGNEFKIDTAALDDTDYYLYVLARDKAYKAGRKTWILRVDQDSDRPRFDFSAGSIDPLVTEPNYDVTPGRTDLFESGGQVRNKLHSAGTIKLTLRDDDSLDLSTLKITAAGSHLDAGGNIVAGTGVELDADQLATVLGTSPAAPTEALLSRTVEISQALLREVLGQGAGTTLDDGVYRLSLEMKDLSAAKEKMTEAAPAPLAAASSPLYFWFAVDSVNPVITNVTPQENAYAGTGGAFTVTAVMEDANGPIYPSLEIYVKDSGGNYVPWGTVDPSKIAKTLDTSVPGKWKYNVSFTVNLTGYEGGEPRLMVAARDRFENTAVLTRTLRVDTVPPTVALPSFTKTLSRGGQDNYVNGIVAFNISAGDNYGLDGITWWLWPADGSFPGAADAWPASPAEVFVPPAGVTAIRGYIDGSSRPYRAYADTRLLDGGTYHLYIAARDQAQNYSLQEDGTNILKTVMADQSTDKPTWQVHNNIGPQNVVGSEGLTLSGTLADDDGFDITTGTVEIRASVSTDLGLNWGAWTSWVPIPADCLASPDGGLTLSLSKMTGNVITSFDLKRPDVFGPSISDGHKRYQLRYHDSADNKFKLSDLPSGMTEDTDPVYGFADDTNADGPAAAGDIFYFVYDTVPPVTAITFYDGANPHPGAIYGPDSEFRVQGTVEELNLLKITDPSDPHDGDYYIDYSIDDGSDIIWEPSEGVYETVKRSGRIYIDAALYPDPLKNWELPPETADAVFAALPDQLHTLTIAAGDGTPKTAMKQASFFKDITAPAIGFSNISAGVLLDKAPVKLEGTDYNVDWYADPANPLGDGSILLDTDAKKNVWYQAQDDWINGRWEDTTLEHTEGDLIRELTTLNYLAGRTPELTGTFADENSSIQVDPNTVDFEYKLDNGTWTSKRVEGTGKVVRWTIPLTGLKDGIHSVSIKVSDLTGNETLPADQVKRYAFRLDSKAPEQAAALSDGGIYGRTAASAPSTETVFTISGTIQEPNLRSLRVEIAKGGTVLHAKDILLADTALDPTVSRTWNRVINLSGGLRNVDAEELAWAYGVPKSIYDTLAGGNDYKATIRAADSGGGGEPVTLDFIIDQTPPELAFGNFESGPALLMTGVTGADTPDAIKAAPNTMNYIYSGSPRITGTARDAATSLRSLESRLSRWDTGAEVWDEIEPWQPLKDSTGGPMPLSNSVSWTKYLDRTTAGASSLDDGLYFLEIRAADLAWSGDSALAGNPTAVSGAAFYIDRELPVLAFDDATQTKVYYSNNPGTNTVTPGKLVFSGTASDLNGIKSLTGELKENTGYKTGENDVDLDGDAWTLTIPAPADVSDEYAGKTYTLQLVVTDNAEQKNTSPLEKVFTLDNVPPAALVTSPETGPANKVTGPAVINGTSSDQQGSGIKTLAYYMGPYTETAPAAGDPAWRPLGGSGGGWDPAQYKKPDGTTSTPGNHPWAGNLVNTGGNVYDWNITVADIAALTREFSIGSTWYNEDDGVPFVTPVDPLTANGPQISSLRIWLKAEDAAGNVTITDSGADGDGKIRGDIWINPLGDIPVVTIENPKPEDDGVNAGQGYGGSIFVTGKASDNDYIWEVVYRVIEMDMTDPNAPVAKRVVVMNGAAVDATVDARYTASGASDTGIVVTSGSYTGSQGWVRADLSRIDTGGAWNFSVNGGGEIDTSYSAPTQAVIQVMAFDGALAHNARGDNLGPVSELSVWFSSGQPSFSNWKVEPLADNDDLLDEWSGLTVALQHNIRGKFRVTGTAADNSSSDPQRITKVEWRGQEAGSNWEVIHQDGTTNNYVFNLVLDSRELLGGDFAASGGPYTMNFRITGAIGAFTAQQAVPVNIDNFAPLAGDTGLTNPKAAGTDYWYTGTALDRNPVNDSDPPAQNLNRVIAWFTGDKEGTRFINLTDGVESTNPGALTTVTALEERTTAFTGTDTDGTVKSGIKYRDADAYRVRINDSTIPDQTYWSGPAGRKDWGFKVDTTKFDDGELFLHYLIYDEAGNASYYRERLVVMNNSPLLNTIAVTTNPRRLANVAGINPAEGRASFTRGTADLYHTGFAARNYLKFEVAPVADRGNIPLHYRLAYVTRASTTTLEAGKIYTIQTPGSANWEGYGAADSQPDTHFIAVVDSTVTLPAGASAYAYAVVDTPELKQEHLNQGGYAAQEFVYPAASFGSTADKIKDGDAFFLLKVWDSVPRNGANPNEPLWATDDEDLQNYDFDIIGLTVTATADNTPPAAEIYDLNPYTETGVAASLNPADSMANAANPLGVGQNAGRAGIYNKAVSVRALERSGHIEPRTNSTVLRNNETQTAGFTNDSVSGAVILRGRAQDKVLLDSISLDFNGQTVTILQRDPADGKLKAPGGVNAWAADEIHWRDGSASKDGHIVEWAYVWDSETLPSTGAVGPVAVKVTAQGWDTGTVTPAAKTVDRVPYITGFQRHANYITGRSKQGWYSFSRGETVTAKGYNLIDDGGDSTITLDGGADIAATGQSVNSVSFTIPDTGKSGRIALETSGGVEAMNSRNDDGKSWNKENWSYTRGSALWTDTRGVHVWESREGSDVDGAYTYMGTSTDSSNAQYISMDLNRRTGMLWGAWSLITPQSVHSALNNNAAKLSPEAGEWRPFRETDIAYDTVETGAGADSVSLIYNYLYVYGNNNQAGLWGKIKRPSADTSAFSPVGYAEHSNSIFLGSANNSNGGPHAIVSPRVTGRLDSSNFAVTYVNQVFNQVYVNFNLNAWALDGPGGISSLGLPVSNSIGFWTAIDVTSASYLVVAYHDAAHDTVRIGYANDVYPAAVGNWTRQEPLTGTSYYSGSGQYISIAIDRQNTDAAKRDTVHLAFYNSVQDTVVYAYGKVGSAFTAEAVDTGFTGGVWTDIALDAAGNPWITYQDANRVNNTDGARIAYRNPALYGTSGNGWEAMSVPTVGDTAGSGYNVADARLNIEAWPPANGPAGVNYSSGTNWPTWNAAVGYQSDKFRVAYYIKPSAF